MLDLRGHGLGSAEDAFEGAAGEAGGGAAVADLGGAFLHRLDGGLDTALDALDEGADLLGRAGDTLGELAQLVGDDGEAAALLASAGGLDGRVEGEQVGLGGDVLDDRDDLADLRRALAEAGDFGGGGVDGACDEGGAFLGGAGGLAGVLGRTGGRGGYVLGAGDDACAEAVGLVDGLGLGLGALDDLVTRLLKERRQMVEDGGEGRQPPIAVVTLRCWGSAARSRTHGG
ncbi:MAG: hypothetical protein FJ035_08150 [Chloroflexi bacterium]|nr:hypothetical protein [Chloroflexota bacterium]